MGEQDMDDDFELVLDPVKDKKFIEDLDLEHDIDPADIPLPDDGE